MIARPQVRFPSSPTRLPLFYPPSQAEQNRATSSPVASTSRTVIASAPRKAIIASASSEPFTSTSSAPFPSSSTALTSHPSAIYDNATGATRSATSSHPSTHPLTARRGADTPVTRRGGAKSGSGKDDLDNESPAESDVAGVRRKRKPSLIMRLNQEDTDVKMAVADAKRKRKDVKSRAVSRSDRGTTSSLITTLLEQIPNAAFIAKNAN